jgi:hypothetical protein
MPEPARPPSARSLSSEDLRLARQIEELYGPTRWRWGEWSGARETSIAKAAATTPRRQPPLPSIIARTLILASLALVALYAAFGDHAPVERALNESLKAVGFVRETPLGAPTAEFLLALETSRPGENVTSDSAVVAQFKTLLDDIAPKCTEDRFALAAATVAANQTLSARGLQDAALSLLAQSNAMLSAQPRSTWPLRCADTINRVAAGMSY